MATNHSDLSDARNFAQSLSTSALSNGQPQLASQIASLQLPDINSKTFTEDLQKYNTQLGTLQGQMTQNPSTALDIQLKKAQIAKIYSDIGSANNTDPATVAGWVQNINSGKAKLSDIPAGLKSAVSTALSQTQTSQTAIQTLQDMVTNNHGFTGAVGAKGFSSLFGILSHPIAGTAAADFKNQFDQTVNSIVLPNLDVLHGLGRVTDREFQALTSAVTALKLSSSEDEFKKNLNLLQAKIDAKVTESKQSNSQAIPSGTDGTNYGFPGYVSDGTQWVKK